MIDLGLPAPRHRLAENETLIHLESRAVEREAAFLAASQVTPTEFGNLFLLRIRQGAKPVRWDAYEFQFREYFERFYLSVDYKCEVPNVKTLAVLGRILPHDALINLRCVARKGDWREGRIFKIGPEFATVHFFDTDADDEIPTDSVIPSCPLRLMEEALRQAGVEFYLSAAIKRHSLWLRRREQLGSASRGVLRWSSTSLRLFSPFS